MGQETVRRFAPLAVAALVLVLLAGVWAVLRTGDQATTPGSAGGPATLQLVGWTPSDPTATADPRYRLADGADLPDEPSDAPVVRLTPVDDHDLRAALGSLGRTLTLSPDGAWSAGGFPCAVAQGSPSATPETASDTSSSSSSSSGSGTSSSPRTATAVSCLDRTTSSTDPTGLPSLDVVLRALGVDPGVVGAAVPQGDGTQRVDVDPEVDGLPTAGLRTSLVTAGAGGQVLSGNGWLVDRSRVGDYPITSAADAFDLLRHTPLPMPLIACPEPLPPDMDPVTCGGPVTVTGAELGLSAQMSADGMLLVPAWLFHVEGSSTRLVQVAVEPRLVETAASDGVTSGGSGGSGGGSSGSGGSAVPPVAPSPGTTVGPDVPVPDPVARFTSVTRSADDRSLDVTFWGGVDTCYSYAVRAVESARQVKLFLVETSPKTGTACIDIAEEKHRTVTLQQPLGLRTVEDGESGVVLLGPTR